MNMSHKTPTHKESFLKRWKNKLPPVYHPEFELTLETVLKEIKGEDSTEDKKLATFFEKAREAGIYEGKVSPALEEFKQRHLCKMIKSFYGGIKLTQEGYEAEWIRRIEGQLWEDNLGRSGPMDEVIQSIEKSPEKWKLYTEKEISPLEAYQQAPSKDSFTQAVKHAFLCGQKMTRDGWFPAWIQRILGKNEWEDSERNTGDLEDILRNIETYPDKWGIYTESESEPDKLESYEEKAKYIIDNKLTHKSEILKNCFAYDRIDSVFCFCDGDMKERFVQRFDTIDLSEWIPFQPKFNKDRFESMFRAIISGQPIVYVEEALMHTQNALNHLDHFYASKEGGMNG